MTTAQIKAHGLGIALPCDMCTLHEAREQELRSIIADQDEQLVACSGVISRRRRREDLMYLAIFALVLAVLYFAVRGTA